jgi:hypothetical protein
MSKFLMKSGIVLALFCGVALQAKAQNGTPDPTLQEIFFTDANLTHITGLNYVGNHGLGVGFDATNNFFPNARTSATAQTIFNPFQIITDSASGNNNARTINAGESIQIGIHGAAVGSNPTSVWVSILQFDPNAAAGNVPVLNPSQQVLAPQRVDFTPQSSASTDGLSFSGTITLQNQLTLGTTYVLAVSPTATPGGSPADFFVVDRTSTTNFGPSANSPFNQLYSTTTNNADQGGAWTQNSFSGAANGLAFRIYAAAAPAPEMSSIAGLFGLTCALGIGFKVRRGRRQA